MEQMLPESAHFRNVVAILLGLSASTVVVGSVEAVGHVWYPTPVVEVEPSANSLAAEKAEPIRRHNLLQATLPALCFVAAAWFCGILSGCYVAGILGVGQGTFCCLVLGLLFFAMIVLSLSQLPAPFWFRVVGLLMLLPGGWIGWWGSQKTLQRFAKMSSVEA